MTGGRQSDQDQPETIRTFLCIEVPRGIKDGIAELQQSLRQIEAQVSWVKPDNMHLTLKFLGDVPASQIAGVIEATKNAIGSSSPFEVTVEGTGCFPSLRSPRVLWVGLQDSSDHQLTTLHETLEGELSGRGFLREPKRFAPHLTIGRVRSPKGAANLAEKLIDIGFASHAFVATEVIVMRSDLNPAGSVYTAQAVLRLEASRS